MGVVFTQNVFICLSNQWLPPLLLEFSAAFLLGLNEESNGSCRKGLEMGCLKADPVLAFQSRQTFRLFVLSGLSLITVSWNQGRLCLEEWCFFTWQGRGVYGAPIEDLSSFSFPLDHKQVCPPKKQDSFLCNFGWVAYVWYTISLRAFFFLPSLEYFGFKMF